MAAGFRAPLFLLGIAKGASVAPAAGFRSALSLLGLAKGPAGAAPGAGFRSLAAVWIGGAAEGPAAVVNAIWRPVIRVRRR